MTSETPSFWLCELHGLWGYSSIDYNFSGHHPHYSYVTLNHKDTLHKVDHLTCVYCSARLAAWVWLLSQIGTHRHVIGGLAGLSPSYTLKFTMSTSWSWNGTLRYIFLWSPCKKLFLSQGIPNYFETSHYGAWRRDLGFFSYKNFSHEFYY